MGASCRAQRGGAGLRLPPNRPGVWSQRGGACIEWGQVSDVKGCAVQSSCVTWTASKRHFMSISTRARRARAASDVRARLSVIVEQHGAVTAARRGALARGAARLPLQDPLRGVHRGGRVAPRRGLVSGAVPLETPARV